jgi:hypothetical protein
LHRQTEAPTCATLQQTAVLSQTDVGNGRILTPPPERRIYPAAPVPLVRLPDESGVPVGVATRLGGGAEMRPLGTLSIIRLAFATRESDPCQVPIHEPVHSSRPHFGGALFL